MRKNKIDAEIVKSELLSFDLQFDFCALKALPELPNIIKKIFMPVFGDDFNIIVNNNNYRSYIILEDFNFHMKFYYFQDKSISNIYVDFIYTVTDDSHEKNPRIAYHGLQELLSEMNIEIEKYCNG